LDIGGIEYSPSLSMNRLLSLVPTGHIMFAFLSRDITAFITGYGLTPDTFKVLVSADRGKPALETEGLWNDICRIVTELGERAATYASYKIS
jgi:hypothetical protein